MASKDTGSGPARRHVHGVVTTPYYPRVFYWMVVAAIVAVALPREQMLLIVSACGLYLVFPHVAYYIGLRARDSRFWGFATLYTDILLNGLTIALLSYRILPAVAITVTSVGTALLLGGPHLLIRVIWMLPLGVLLGWPVFDFTPFAPLGGVAEILVYLLLASYVWLMAYSVNKLTRQTIATRNKLRQTNAQVLEQSETLSTMYEITSAVNSSLKLDDVMNAVMAGLQKIVSFDLIGTGLIDKKQRALVIREISAGGVELNNFEGVTIPLSEANSTFVRVVNTGQPAYFPIMRASDREFMCEADRAVYDAAPSKSLLVVPLIVENRVIGTLTFANSVEEFTLDDKDIETIGQYVEQLATAIRNSRLFEDARTARAEAQAASETKSQFLANMSHELRTPMNAVIGYSEMLQEEAEDEGLDHFVPDLKKIQAAGRHLLELINGILDLSKVEANKMELYLETADVRQLVEGVAGTVKPLVEKNENTLEVTLDDDLGNMYADVTKVRQSLLNLLSNASKFTEQGKISLAVHRERAADGDWLSFIVTDSGIGMTPEQQDKLFQPFTQADASTTRKYGGTGLGLTISKRFCEMMGGDITVTSVPGEGSTFTIGIPATVRAAKPKETEAEAPTLQQAPADGVTVLVIDDDPNMRDILRKILSKEDFHVVEAADGKEGLRLARDIHPNAITLDVLMPETDGWLVLSELKSDAELADIPVVMLTMVDDKNMGYELGAAECLTKPVDRNEITAILNRLTEHAA